LPFIVRVWGQNFTNAPLASKFAVEYFFVFKNRLNSSRTTNTMSKEEDKTRLFSFFAKKNNNSKPEDGGSSAAAAIREPLH